MGGLSAYLSCHSAGTRHGNIDHKHLELSVVTESTSLLGVEAR